MCERADWTAFVRFLSRVARDPTYDGAFRAEYAADRTRDEEAYIKKRAIVHSIWRVNGRNRQALDELVARLDRSGSPATSLVRAVRGAAKVTIRFDGASGTCDFTNGVVPWPRRVVCLDASGEVTHQAVMTSEACLWIQCVNVIAHYIEYTSAQIALGDSKDEEWLDAQWGVWRGCLAHVERWSEAA